MSLHKWYMLGRVKWRARRTGFIPKMKINILWVSSSWLGPAANLPSLSAAMKSAIFVRRCEAVKSRPQKFPNNNIKMRGPQRMCRRVFSKGSRLRRCPEGEKQAQCVKALGTERGCGEERLFLTMCGKKKKRVNCQRVREKRGGGAGGERVTRGSHRTARGEGGEEGLFVDHWQIMGSLGQTLLKKAAAL